MTKAVNVERIGPPAIVGVAVLCCVLLSAAMAVCLAPVLPQIRDHFAGQPGADFLTKGLVTVVGVAAIVGSPLTGWLLDRYGPRRLLVGVTAVFLVFGAGGGLLFDSLPLILLTRFVAGMAGTIADTAAVAIIMMTFHASVRNRWLGYMGTVGVAWATLATLVASQLGHFGWRAAFLVHLLALPILAVLIFAFPADHQREIVGQGPPKASHPNFASIAILVVTGITVGAVLCCTSIFIPFHLDAVGFKDPRQIGAMLLAQGLAAGASSLLYGAIRTHLSVRIIFFLGFAGAGAGYLLLLGARSETAVYLVLLLLGFGSGTLLPNLYAWSAKRAGSTGEARALGIAMAGFYCGPLVAQIVISVLAGTRPSAPLLILGMAAITGWIVALTVRKGRSATG